jgi:hypothetical protein
MNKVSEAVEKLADFCLNLQENATPTRKKVVGWLEAKILPRFESVLDEVDMPEMEPEEGEEPESLEMPEGDKPEGEEHEYDEKDEIKNIAELANITNAMKISLEQIDDDDVKMELSKSVEALEGVLKDLFNMHDMEDESEEEPEEDDIVEPEGEGLPAIEPVEEEKKKIVEENESFLLLITDKKTWATLKFKELREGIYLVPIDKYDFEEKSRSIIRSLTGGQYIEMAPTTEISGLKFNAYFDDSARISKKPVAAYQPSKTKEGWEEFVGDVVIVDTESLPLTKEKANSIAQALIRVRN